MPTPSILHADWGVLNYTRKVPEDRLENRFMGRVFRCPRSGHQFNQHYLDNIFPLNPTGRFTHDPQVGDFMDIDVLIGQHEDSKAGREENVTSLYATGPIEGFWGHRTVDRGGANKDAEMLNVTATSPAHMSYIVRNRAYSKRERHEVENAGTEHAVVVPKWGLPTS
ncbi:hypothetical protein BGZ60DRAFT_436840 [Tricladium varicosporioides]|nr:hypothetical protein BGZ60DRAFT_436840 [Hymenoscyphus varicosporioides]